MESDEQELERQELAILDAISKEKDFGVLVGHYVDFRDQVEVIKKEMTERMAPFTGRMNRIEARLLELLLDSGQENAKTKFGTAYKKPFTSAKVADWNVFIAYVKENNAFDLLTKAVAKDAVKARIEETGTIVPGIDIVTGQSVGIRRA